MFVQVKKQLLALCAATMMMSMTACDSKMDPNDPQSVRKYLTKQQIPFTPNQFVSYAVNGDTAKMTLFLQASFEIDAPADNETPETAYNKSRKSGNRRIVFL